MAAGGPGSKMAAAPPDKMAANEKRRPCPAAAGGDPSRAAVAANGVPGGHGAACFLLEAGVTDMVRAALLKVLEARPEEPVPFLAAYFEKLAQSGAEAEEADAGDLPRQLQLRLDRAAWALGLAHHSHRTAFDNNVGLAYDCLGAAAGKRKKPGVTGRLYSELLRRLCRERGLPEEAAQPLLGKLQCREHEAVPFDLFRYGALACLVLLDFVAKAGTLYGALGGPGGADKRVCVAVLGALEEALRPGPAAPLPLRYLEAGRALGPDRLALAMDTALAGGVGVAMKKEEFLRRAAALFLARVRAVN